MILFFDEKPESKGGIASFLLEEEILS